MTHREKIEMLKITIEVLYVKEGRSKSYISRLLDVDRGILTKVLNDEWNIKQGNTSYLTPSNQKFLNKHKNLIKSRLDNDIAIVDIGKELGVSRQYVSRTIIPHDAVLKKALEDYHRRRDIKAQERRDHIKSKSSLNYNYKKIEDEKWKAILGYEGYEISNKGRVRSYKKTYDEYILLSLIPNERNNGRVQVWVGGKCFSLARLVGHAFVEGYSEINNTINHKDRNVQNNFAENLEWVSQSENNQHAYDTGRDIVISYQKYEKFKKIVLDDKYEFKTIKALAKFIGKSETQTRRYIDKETESSYKFEFIY